MSEHNENQSNRQRLNELRESLLALHKTLIDSERIAYEATFGTIPGPNDFLRLLLNDPWFAWLRPLSGLITQLDETLDDKEPLTTPATAAFFTQTAELLTPSEGGEGFGRHYFEAFQREPNVIMAHAAVAKLLRAPK